jgi:hypothetical protein
MLAQSQDVPISRHQYQLLSRDDGLISLRFAMKKLNIFGNTPGRKIGSAESAELHLPQ